MEVHLITPAGALENPTMQEIQKTAWSWPIAVRMHWFLLKFSKNIFPIMSYHTVTMV